LVTGSAGFIGARTCAMLLAKGYDVMGIDNVNDYYDISLKKYRIQLLTQQPRFEFCECDIEDVEKLEEIFRTQKFDAVINLAARAGVRYSLENPTIYYTTNALGTLNVLECMRKTGVKKLIIASTSSLYSGQPMPFTEERSTSKPISPYAASKKAAETLVYSYHYQFGFDVTILRYFTVYGPASRPDMLVWSVVEGVLHNKPITIYGKGDQARDFTYIDDIARGTIAALGIKGFEIINLGGGNTPTSILELIHKIEELTGASATLQFKPGHSADMDVTWANIDKAQLLLNWKPEVTLTDGLQETIRWHEEKWKPTSNQ